jgi:hypothetical protein
MRIVLLAFGSSAPESTPEGCFTVQTGRPGLSNCAFSVLRVLTRVNVTLVTAER